ncbi:uncharacterized protein FFMR_06389 [Fusarium fujikuroi]|nr:uncharacterized protein FFM5_06629 [Fusarium fujikuroi]SCO41438.1 uncharacterized protein FFMR_06389 [Fusarium fujikuroi]SCV55399.1 uncharacterized protein FFB14_14097 [Fusarium fujikuroi]
MRDTRKDCQLFSNSYGLISSLLKSYDSMLLTSAKLTTYTTGRSSNLSTHSQIYHMIACRPR